MTRRLAESAASISSCFARRSSATRGRLLSSLIVIVLLRKLLVRARTEPDSDGLPDLVISQPQRGPAHDGRRDRLGVRQPPLLRPVEAQTSIRIPVWRVRGQSRTHHEDLRRTEQAVDDLDPVGSGVRVRLKLADPHYLSI